MDRRVLFRLDTIVALGLLAGSVAAQQRALKDQLLAAWSLVSAECIGEALVGRPVLAGGDQMLRELQFPLVYTHASRHA